MAFSHLTPEQIDGLKEAFSEAQMPYDEELRGLLFAGVNYLYFQNLDTYSNSQRQLVGDLDDLNATEQLDDKSVPFKTWLENAAEQFRPRVQAGVFLRALENIKAGADTDAIVDGLEALSKLIRRNETAYAAVTFYRRTFQTALGEIDVIADYKLMHDELHKLQLGWPDDIGPTVEAINTNPAAQMTVERYLLLLKETATQLRTIYKAEAVAKGEKSGVDREEIAWIEEFDLKHQEMDSRIKAGDGPNIEKSFDWVKAELTSRLSRLNTRLKKAIDTLHLKDLIGAMSEVCGALKVLAPERVSAQVEQYEAGIKELTALNDELSRLIVQHDKWQEADTRLRMLGDMAEAVRGQPGARSAVQEETRLSTLNNILLMIDRTVQPLLEGDTGAASGNMMRSAQGFRTSLETKNTDLAEQWFDMYRQQAWYFFFELDKKMKERCEELRRIGEKLRKVDTDLDQM